MTFLLRTDCNDFLMNVYYDFFTYLYVILRVIIGVFTLILSRNPAVLRQLKVKGGRLIKQS